VQTIAALRVNLRDMLGNGGGGTDNEHTLHGPETVRDTRRDRRKFLRGCGLEAALSLGPRPRGVQG
jgi:hypothetical protein